MNRDEKLASMCRFDFQKPLSLFIGFWGVENH